MYRYVFNPHSCRWEIQLLRWGFFWRTLRCLSFGDINDAKRYALNTGLVDQYQEQRPFNHTPVTKEQADEQS